MKNSNFYPSHAFLLKFIRENADDEGKRSLDLPGREFKERLFKEQSNTYREHEGNSADSSPGKSRLGKTRVKTPPTP